MKNAKAYKDVDLLRWEDGKEHSLPQDFADMPGWKELAVKMDSICASLPNLDHTLIFCDNCREAGAINYYTKNKKIKATTFNADYINWFNLNQKITDVILVKEADDEDKNRQVEIPLFNSVYLADKRVNQNAREQEISIYVLFGAKVNVTERIKDEIVQKQKYQL